MKEALMNLQLPGRMAKPAFLAWVQGREGRYELVDGRVVMMVGASRAHAKIVRNLLLALHSQLDLRHWEATADFGLDTGPETLRYPDIVIDRAGGALGDYTAIEPVMLAEVLSPSSEKIDHRDKANEYLRLPSLQAYLIVAQDRVRTWLWLREQGRFAAEAAVIDGLDKTVSIPPLGLQLPLAALYAGVNVGQ
jgi:Uma2 family endonuclease